jgi:hypothetical protein
MPADPDRYTYTVEYRRTMEVESEELLDRVALQALARVALHEESALWNVVIDGKLYPLS